MNLNKTTVPLLTTTDLERISGIDRVHVQRWVREGRIPPITNQGAGPGNYRYFGLLEAIAVTFASRWRQVGAGPDMVANILQSILALGLDGIGRACAESRTFWMPLPPSPDLPEGGAELVAPRDAVANMRSATDDPDALVRSLDLNDTVQYVLAKIAELQRRPLAPTDPRRSEAGQTRRNGPRKGK